MHSLDPPRAPGRLALGLRNRPRVGSRGVSRVHVVCTGCVCVFKLMCVNRCNRMDHTYIWIMVYRKSCEVCMEYASRDRLGLRLPVLRFIARGARGPAPGAPARGGVCASVRV